MDDSILNAAFVASATGGEIFCDSGLAAHGISTDSRNIVKGQIFAAIRGERTDGNRYVVSAAENGAGGIICEFPPEVEEISKFPCFVVTVENTVEAMGRLASAYRDALECTVIGVTGSVGKTTTRSLIQSVLSVCFRTCGTSGNHNNEIGLPYSVLNTDPQAEFAVYELGMSDRGEIDYLSSICRPAIGVITGIGTAHIEFLGSREAIRDAKMEIAGHLSGGGLLLLNGDEPLLEGVEGAVYCSLTNEKSDIRAVNIRYTDGGMLFDVESVNSPKKTDFFVPMYGEHIVLDALFAYAAGTMFGESDDDIKRGLAGAVCVGDRQRVTKKDGITYICDYYNASPESVRASVLVAERLAREGGGRAVLVLGSVLELGVHSAALHREMGEFAATHGDILLTFGEEAENIADGAGSGGIEIMRFADAENTESVINALKSILKPGDTVLFKASHGMRLGRIASVFTENNEK